MDNSTLLNGVRVIELASYIAAPACGRLLADWGADVIKIEPPSGDVWHNWGPSLATPCTDEENPLWDLINPNKRAISLNLKRPEGREVLRDLLKDADVLLTNSRPDTLEEMGFGYESLKKEFPGLIYAIVTGFGEKGPDADRPGFDVVAFWARSGFMVDLVKPDEYPLYSPAGFGDLAVGNTLFGGICAALFNRYRTGKGDRISISLYGTAIWMSALLITSTQERYANKFPKTRAEGNPIAIPYKCKDGEWIIIALLNHDKHWAPFCKAMEREDLLTDERFQKREALHKHKKELIPILEETFARKDSAEWVARLRAEDVVHERLQHYREVSKDEQALVNDFVIEGEMPNGSKAMFPNTPLRFSEHAAQPFRRGPFLGEHTKQILGELGYSAEKIDELVKDKVLVAR